MRILTGNNAIILDDYNGILLNLPSSTELSGVIEFELSSVLIIVIMIIIMIIIIVIIIIIITMIIIIIALTDIITCMIMIMIMIMLIRFVNLEKSKIQ